MSENDSHQSAILDVYTPEKNLNTDIEFFQNGALLSHKVKNSRRLSEVSENRNNLFDVIRLLAASLVIFSHCFDLSGNYNSEPLRLLLHRQSSLGILSVFIFFSLSGFLIAKSWVSRPQLGIFMKNRLLRIWPGLITCTLLTVCIVGPCFTVLNPLSYWHHHDTWAYFKNLLLVSKTVFSLPGVFEFNPLQNTVNGSLWSIPFEFRMYLFIAFLGVTKIINRRWFILALMPVLLYIYGAHFSMPPHRDHMASMLYFLMGTLCYLFRDKIHLNKSSAIMATMVFCLGLLNPAIFWLTSLLSVPLLVLLFGYSSLPFLQKLTSRGDYSYGIYIYAFPIQQILMSVWGVKLDFGLFVTISFILTYIMAGLSWHYIEKPALRLKHFSLSMLISRFFPKANPVKKL